MFFSDTVAAHWHRWKVGGPCFGCKGLWASAITCSAHFDLEDGSSTFPQNISSTAHLHMVPLPKYKQSVGVKLLRTFITRGNVEYRKFRTLYRVKTRVFLCAPLKHEGKWRHRSICY